MLGSDVKTENSPNNNSLDRGIKTKSLGKFKNKTRRKKLIYKFF
jgi:hypothetical protein